mgnify:CR=1 FL=1
MEHTELSKKGKRLTAKNIQKMHRKYERLQRLIHAYISKQPGNLYLLEYNLQKRENV